MKLHIGVDRKPKPVHSAVATAANVHDPQVLNDLLYGNETRVWGDSVYAGQRAAMKEATPRGRDSGRHKASRHRTLSAQERSRNRTRSSTISRVEQVFHVLKCRFDFTKVWYRGLGKNASHSLIQYEMSLKPEGDLFMMGG
jgi:IS5 family transposase